MLKIILGLLEPGAGRVTVLGRRPDRHGEIGDPRLDTGQELGGGNQRVRGVVQSGDQHGFGNQGACIFGGERANAVQNDAKVQARMGPG